MPKFAFKGSFFTHVKTINRWKPETLINDLMCFMTKRVKKEELNGSDVFARVCMCV